MHDVFTRDKAAYSRAVPKLWKDTVEEHRRDVRTAILEAAWALAQEHGVRGVTMGLVADQAGISRATLYKYFRGVDDILVAAHTEHVRAHLAKLRTALDTAGTPRQGLERLIEHYAEICFRRGRDGGAGVAALVHTGAQHHHDTHLLNRLVVDAVRAAQQAGEVRADVTPKVLAAYCLSAAEGAGALANAGDARRLAGLIKQSLT